MDDESEVKSLCWGPNSCDSNLFLLSSDPVFLPHYSGGVGWGWNKEELYNDLSWPIAYFSLWVAHLSRLISNILSSGTPLLTSAVDLGSLHEGAIPLSDPVKIPGLGFGQVCMAWLSPCPFTVSGAGPKSCPRGWLVCRACSPLFFCKFVFLWGFLGSFFPGSQCSWSWNDQTSLMIWSGLA